MRCRTLVFIGVLALLIVLAGCSKAECKKDADCVKPYFTASCTDKTCVYEPIPGECGNGLCDGAETKCSCEADCGICTGSSGKYLVQQCNAQDECVEDIPITKQKPITLTREISTGGSKISVTTVYNQPFNLKKDQMELEFKTNVLAKAMSDLRITRLELTGRTADRRTIAMSDKQVNQNLYEAAKNKEYLIIEFPTAEKDGELTNLELKVYLDYVLTSGTTTTPKSAILKSPYKSLKFAWANPEKSPGCPECNDGNPGTKDVCSEATNYFCDYQPIAGACGNGVCDSAENQCTCAQDCGPCSGGGSYITMSCVGTICKANIKSGISKLPKSLFDDRNLNVFHFQNNYKYSQPFDITSDKFILEFNLYQQQETVSSVKVTDMRILEGTQELAHVKADKTLTLGQQETVEITIPALGVTEQEKSISLRVWYEYVKDGETIKKDYSKSLGKITFLSPDI